MLDGEFQCLRLHELALVDPALEIIRDFKMGCLEAEEAFSPRNLLIMVLHDRALRVPVGAKGDRIDRCAVWKRLKAELGNESGSILLIVPVILPPAPDAPFVVIPVRFGVGETRTERRASPVRPRPVQFTADIPENFPEDF